MNECWYYFITDTNVLESISIATGATGATNATDATGATGATNAY